LILAPILSVLLVLMVDLAVGDPKNRYHPTAWIGRLVGKLAPYGRSNNPHLEKIYGVILVVMVITIISAFTVLFLSALQSTENLDTSYLSKLFTIILSAVAIGILLKTTIAIKGMIKHVSNIMTSLSGNDLEDARNRLSMIVKRNTKDLDKQHILSATLESISENIVDGITGPLFYFSIFGLLGAFVYRTVNTIDSMIGYKTDIFRNLGWFGANCDKVLNFLPARITSGVIILSCFILAGDWRHSIQIMKRDGSKTSSPNAGYPMATMAGALGVRLEKIGHYTLGDDKSEITEKHLKTALSIMKITTILFVLLITIPIILALSYVGWWFSA